MTGPELIAHIRQNPAFSETPIILTSGLYFANLNRDQVNKKAIKAKADAGVAKPINDFAHLIKIASEVLSSSSLSSSEQTAPQQP